MNTSLAHKGEAQLSPLSLLSKNKHYVPDSQVFGEDIIDNLQGILTVFSTSNFMDALWDVTLASSHKAGGLRFPTGITLNEGTILRALTLNQLRDYASFSICKRSIHDACVFFSFLNEKSIPLENCRSGVINRYISHLDANTELSAPQKNNLMRTVASLMTTCSKYGLLQGSGIIDCSHRWKAPNEPKRAPDSCVTNALDVLFFDIGNSAIPDSYRCIYLLLRLIPNRISEVLAMDIDCLTYPNTTDTYTISIPTGKETPYHAPVQNPFHRKLSGWAEGLLFSSIQTQRRFAQQMQGKLKLSDCGYLFVSPKAQRLISASDFNSFLKKLCEDNHILDANGNQTKVTSHDLRHIAIGERLRGNIVSPIMTMLESNHSTPSQTFGYGYQSHHDEATHLGSISAEVLKNAFDISFDEHETVAPREFREHKYHSMEKQPFTRFIPSYGICYGKACASRFEQCFQCRHFHPNEAYREYIEAAIIKLNEKIAELQKKSGSSEAVTFNQGQLEMFQLFLDRTNSEYSISGDMKEVI